VELNSHWWARRLGRGFGGPLTINLALNMSEVQVIPGISENNGELTTWSRGDVLTRYRAFKRPHNRRPTCGFYYSDL